MSVAPRVVFLGNAPWSVPALAALYAEGPTPVLVITRSPRPAGRGSELRSTAVAEAATGWGLPLLQTETVRSGGGLAALRSAEPDVMAVVAYGEILTPEVLGVPPLGGVNLHFSLLPRWRGASPVQHTILAGDPVAGITTMLMDEGIDTGPILEQAELDVMPDDDTGSLGTRLAARGGDVLRHSLAGLADGTVEARPQPEDGVTLAPRLGSDDRWIDWSQDAQAIGRRVRALAPEPGASTRFRGDVLKVLRGEPVAGSGVPGVVVPLDPAVSGVAVGTGDGVFRILRVAPAGRRRMEATAWARGARFAPGERLG